MLLAPGNDVAASYTCPILKQMSSQGRCYRLSLIRAHLRQGEPHAGRSATGVEYN